MKKPTKVLLKLQKKKKTQFMQPLKLLKPIQLLSQKMRAEKFSPLMKMEKHYLSKKNRKIQSQIMQYLVFISMITM